MNQEPIDSLIKSPSVIAMDRLSKLSYKGFYKEFYTELSHISREFIESTRYIRALEMTTEDIIKNKDLFLIEEKKFDNWVALLFKADMVKYARQDVDHSEMISDKDEIIKTMRDLHQNGVKILTLGQYLRPTINHLPVKKYIHPDEFAEVKTT